MRICNLSQRVSDSTQYLVSELIAGGDADVARLTINDRTVDIRVVGFIEQVIDASCAETEDVLSVLRSDATFQLAEFYFLLERLPSKCREFL